MSTTYFPLVEWDGEMVYGSERLVLDEEGPERIFVQLDGRGAYLNEVQLRLLAETWSRADTERQALERLSPGFSRLFHQLGCTHRMRVLRALLDAERSSYCWRVDELYGHHERFIDVEKALDLLDGEESVGWRLPL